MVGKLSIFEITLDNVSGVFYAGTALKGYVTIELTDTMDMRGICLNFEGKARTRWSEGSQDNRRHYSANEDYFDQDVLLHGIWSSQGFTKTQLFSGRHTFPFEFMLPPNLPSSFEGVSGRVRYVVSCKIDKPWKFDHKTKRPFTIISILDLNQQPNIMSRVQGHKEKNLCCLCCKSGPIRGDFTIDRQGYVPGEAIKLNAEISNGSSRKMDKSYVELIMKTTFHAKRKGKTKKSSKRVAMVSRPSIEGNSEDVWSGEQLVVPPLPPSFLVGCSIIDIEYILQLNVDPSGPGLNLEIPLNIIIGTIPLASVVEQFPPMPPIGFNGASYDHQAWGAPPQPFPNLPPPSYNECITGKVDAREEGDAHTLGDLNFAPAYTYYNWGNTPGELPPEK